MSGQRQGRGGRRGTPRLAGPGGQGPGLPRPVKQVLEAPPLDGAVVRTWARIQVSRRVRPPLSRGVRLALPVGVVLLALGAGWWLAHRSAPAPAAAAAPAPLPPPAFTVSSLLAQGRAAPGPVRAPRPAHPPAPAQPPAPTLPPPDPVAALLASAAQAAEGHDAQRAVALLIELEAHHADDPRTPAALFARGRLQLEALHRPREAAHSFTRALELGPPEELVVPLWHALQGTRPEDGE